jgi:hypothetical protein
VNAINAGTTDFGKTGTVSIAKITNTTSSWLATSSPSPVIPSSTW